MKLGVSPAVQDFAVLSPSGLMEAKAVEEVCVVSSTTIISSRALKPVNCSSCSVKFFVFDSS